MQEDGLKIAPRVSPTNLGFLFNVRQVACDFGYLTVPEFVALRSQDAGNGCENGAAWGHFLNWYDTLTLVPLRPAIISSVDNGNLVASLWTLQQGCRELLDRPLLQPELTEGIVDHLYVLTTLGALPRRKFSAMEKSLRGPGWLQYLLTFPDAILENIRARVLNSKRAAEAGWFQTQTQLRIKQIRDTVETYVPWLLPEFAELQTDSKIRLQNRSDERHALQHLPAFIDDLSVRLQSADSAMGAESGNSYRKLLSLLPSARANVMRLIEELNKVADQAGVLADEMDFEFLFNERRQLLSVAFEVEKRQLLPACYDLLASEARIAYLVAIAKDEIPQESWFQLGRAPMAQDGMVGLLSWTGTMFEYLMPTLWTRIYPTLCWNERRQSR